jgi:hypothetical protein
VRKVERDQLQLEGSLWRLSDYQAG